MVKRCRLQLLILFAPHFGLGTNGALGKTGREGMRDESSACGAVVGAYNGLKKAASDGAVDQKLKTDVDKYDDVQMSYMKLHMRPRMKNAPKAPSELVYIT